MEREPVYQYQRAYKWDLLYTNLEQTHNIFWVPTWCCMCQTFFHSLSCIFGLYIPSTHRTVAFDASEFYSKATTQSESSFHFQELLQFQLRFRLLVLTSWSYSICYYWKLKFAALINLRNNMIPPITTDKRRWRSECH